MIPRKRFTGPESRRFLWSLAICMVCSAQVSADPIRQEHRSGPVSVTVELNPSEPLIGDTVTLTITVVSDANVEVLMPEFGEALQRFSIEDFVPRESIDEEGRLTSSQQYRLQLPSSGSQLIPPILIEYVDGRPGEKPAPEGLDAYEVLTEPIAFNVQSVLPEDAAAELKPPLEKLDPIAPPQPALWPWVLGFILLMALATPMLLEYIADVRRRQRRKSAYEVARWRMDQLLRHPRLSSSEIEEFYVNLTNIIRRYLEDRFELRAPELTTEEFLNSIQESPDLSRDHQSLLREFLRNADLVKFARAQPSESDVQQSIDAATRFLEETRENAPLMDVEDEVQQDASPEEVATDG